MAESPVNGDRPAVAQFRRSSSQFASIPERDLSFHERAGLVKDDAAADVLYTHPNVRIFKFQPPTDALKSLDKTQKTLPDADYPIDAIEVLPWRARTETLASKGKLMIEKVQGSVHFLKSGDLIHTIMKNSQCWCVDGQSKFVMRIGKLRYQRIEFPSAEPEDKAKVEEFKEVISKILRFEKTPCPFIRGFHVDLPDDAITPRRRGPWKRRESLTPVTPDDDARTTRRSKTSRTMSMRGMPPSSYPSKSANQIDFERPRTASTPTSSARFSFPDLRTETPVSYASGEDYTDSDRHDSESDRPETGPHSEVDESDKEPLRVPTLKLPFKNVATILPTEARAPKTVFTRSVKETAAMLDQWQARKTHGSETAKLTGRKAGVPSVEPPLSAREREVEVLPLENSLSPQEKEPSPTNGQTQQLPELSEIAQGPSSEDVGEVEQHQSAMPNGHDPYSALKPIEQQEDEINLVDSMGRDAVVVSNLHSSANLAHDESSHGDQTKARQPSSDTGQAHESQSESNTIPLSEQVLHSEQPVSDENEHPSEVVTEQESRHESLDLQAAEFDDSSAKTAESNTSDTATDVQIQTQPAQEFKQQKTLESEPDIPAPPHETTLDHSPPSLGDSSEDLVRVRTNDDAASTVSVDSFHTLISDDGETDTRSLLSTRPFHHRREFSEVTITQASLDPVMHLASTGLDKAQSPDIQAANSSHSRASSTALQPNEQTSSGVSDQSEIRTRLRHRRSLSPLPPASILAPPSPTEQASVIPSALLQKAATLAVIKPIEIVILVVHILARIAGGATVNDLVSGDLFRRPVMRRTASGTFDQNVRGRSLAQQTDTDEEDDYGVPVHGRRRSSVTDSANHITFRSKRDNDDANSFASLD